MISLIESDIILLFPYLNQIVLCFTKNGTYVSAEMIIFGLHNRQSSYVFSLKCVINELIVQLILIKCSLLGFQYISIFTTYNNFEQSPPTYGNQNMVGISLKQF